jgi:hypothetical protein
MDAKLQCVFSGKIPNCGYRIHHDIKITTSLLMRTFYTKMWYNLISYS